jgi:hypothetical protein
MILFFLGRSIEGILHDAETTLFSNDHEKLVLSRDNDQMPAPAGIPCIPASMFQPEVGRTYIVVANGGTTQQLIPTIKRLVESGVSFTIYDLQQDRMTCLW